MESRPLPFRLEPGFRARNGKNAELGIFSVCCSETVWPGSSPVLSVLCDIETELAASKFMPKKALPEFVPPMMAESAKAPFDSPDWVFEVKLDGYRAITVFDDSGKAHLWSRNRLSLEAKFPAVANAVAKLKLRSTTLDGEVVAVDENGIPRFQLLQRVQKQPTAPTLYYVFDLLWNDGADVTSKPILERRALLETIVKPVPASSLELTSKGRESAL